MNSLPPVVAAMSGGVDSSVAAALLVKQGFPVTGIMLRLWSEDGCESDNRCCTPDSIRSARQVASKLDIPFYVIDAKDFFYNNVVENFLDNYSGGNTPNPCLVCNSTVRWGFLMDQAISLGASYLATGHYAQLLPETDGKVQLIRGLDRTKDQSYVLSMLDQHQLTHTMLPLGNLTKSQVRNIAADMSFQAANKPDSQDLCFLGGQDYRNFLSKYRSDTFSPGNIVDTAGNIIGKHHGLPFFTIGQRKGIHISASKPLYVIRKDAGVNQLVVGGLDELGGNRLLTGKVNWIDPEIARGTFRATVQIRYKARDIPATVFPDENGCMEIVFDDYIKDITPGQAAVIYIENRVIGGGIIQE